MDRHERLKLFVLVTEAGNFSAAGKALKLAQSQVSKGVRALEEEFRVTLLRPARSVSRTKARGCSPMPRGSWNDTTLRRKTFGEKRWNRTAHCESRPPTARAARSSYPTSQFSEALSIPQIDHMMTDRFIDLAEMASMPRSGSVS